MIKEDLAIDQAMFVTTGVQSRRTYDARVAKIARKYVTIEIWRGPEWTSEIEFDIATQKERGNTGHYAAVFQTPEQHELAERKHAAENGLLEIGLTRRMGADRLTLEEIEAVVATVRGMRADPEDRGRQAGA